MWCKITYENAIEQSDKVYDAIASSAQNIIIKKEPLLDTLKDGVTIEPTKAEGVPWYYTARVDNDLIIVENAIHENNMSNRAYRRGSSNPTANLSNDDRNNQKILEIDSKTIKRIVSEVICEYICKKIALKENKMGKKHHPNTIEKAEKYANSPYNYVQFGEPVGIPGDDKESIKKAYLAGYEEARNNSKLAWFDIAEIVKIAFSECPNLRTLDYDSQDTFQRIANRANKEIFGRHYI